MQHLETRNKVPWNRPSAKQQVSNRSILRVQQLSNELRDQLNEMAMFINKGEETDQGLVNGILFAARDFTIEQTEERRWYNARLCGSFDFPDSEAQDGQPDLRKWVTKHAEHFRCLFRAAKKFDRNTKASFEAFVTALSEEDPDRKAVDQLLIALAVLPYRGVLLTLLEQSFFPESAGGKLVGDCFHFAPVGGKTNCFEFRQFDEFHLSDVKVERKMDPKMEFPAEINEDKIALNRLFENFLLQFTRGQSPKSTIDVSEHEFSSPYDPDLSSLNGFVIPAYDVWCNENPPSARNEIAAVEQVSGSKGWRGGMAGWIVVILKGGHEYTKQFESNEDLYRRHSWLHFTHLIRAYVRRVREANIRDLLEDYAEPEGTHELPRDYFLKHLHQIIGFRTHTNVEKGNSQAGLKTLVVPEDTYREEVKPDVLPLRDTFWTGCGKSGEGTTFPPGTRRLCALFLDELELVRAKREEGRTATLEGFFHQIKNLGESAERAWLLSGDETAFRKPIAASFSGDYEDLKMTRWCIAPFPELYEALGATLSLWGRKDVLSPSSNKLADLLTASVDLAMQCLMTSAFRGHAIKRADKRKQAKKKIEALNGAKRVLLERLSAFYKPLSQITLNEPSDQDSDQYRRNRSFKHLLVRLCEETMIHGDLASSIIVELKRAEGNSDRWDLIWKNSPRPHSPRDALQKELNAMALRGASFPGIKRGSQVNRDLVAQLLGTLESNFSSDGHQQEFRATSLAIQLQEGT